MTGVFRGLLVPALLALGALGGLPLDAGAQASAPASPSPRRFTMESLHGSGGVPRGWKFTLPPGDPEKVGELFRELECYKCHAINGESFPPPGGDGKNMVGEQGFHYGANVTLPEGAQTITVAIDRATMQAMESAKGRFVKPLTVVFDLDQARR